MIVAVYPGSFDPFTNGHLDILNRAANLFEKVIVAASSGGRKSLTFSLEERLGFIEHAAAKFSNVQAASFSGLLVEFASRMGAKVIIRGLREISDFEYEYQMAVMNSKLAPEVETVFLSTCSDYYFVSSSLIKEVAALGGDVSGLVPPDVLTALQRKFRSAGESDGGTNLSGEGGG
ncbi:MAG: pantetheine-phosphate adenylyltransferase [bacterium]|jgi:pantetheine-phosphate adenylyltransferase